MPSQADDILLATQQPFCLSENMTLIVEDMDPQQGVVWLEIYNKSQNGTRNSTVLGLGEHLNCSEANLTLKEIYAGEKEDLVSLEFNSERNASRTPQGSPVASL